MNKRPMTFVGDQLVRKHQLGQADKLRLERNRAYLFSVASLLCVTALALAVTVLANQRVVIPVVSVIDANGHVIKQQIVNPQSIVAQDSFIQSQVYSFVTYCNTFDPNWRQHYADLCRLHSTPEVARQYDQETSPDNTSNPYYQLGQSGRRYPRITGITALSKDAYQVAFQLITEKPGASPQTDYYTGLVRFTFTLKPIALGDRWENPLGFTATAYRKDQELSRQ
jgi:type IV secretion system protein VirB8